jgi:hypothetical protein
MLYDYINHANNCDQCGGIIIGDIEKQLCPIGLKLLDELKSELKKVESDD